MSRNPGAKRGGPADDGVEQLALPTGEFLVGRHEGKPASCGGVLLPDPATAELTRVYTRLDLVEARGLYVRRGYREIPAYTTGPYMDIWYGKDL